LNWNSGFRVGILALCKAYQIVPNFLLKLIQELRFHFLNTVWNAKYAFIFSWFLFFSKIHVRIMWITTKLSSRNAVAHLLFIAKLKLQLAEFADNLVTKSDTILHQLTSWLTPRTNENKTCFEQVSRLLYQAYPINIRCRKILENTIKRLICLSFERMLLHTKWRLHEWRNAKKTL
jgi:hypothetical protein